MNSTNQKKMKGGDGGGFIIDEFFFSFKGAIHIHVVVVYIRRGDDYF